MIKEKALNNESKNYIITNSIVAKLFEKEKLFVCFDKNKIPFNPISKIQVDVSKEENRTDLKNALIGLKNTHKFKGIGITLGNTSLGNLTGLDIDNCIDKNGNISNEAKEIINELDTYTEISPSGTGIHCLFFAKKMESACKVSNLNWCKCLEIYDSNRYFTFTGNCINDKKVELRQSECDYIYNKYFQKPINIKKTYKLTSNFSEKKLSDYKQHFKKALKLDNILHSYWIGKRPYTDESSNDFGFISKLCYWLRNSDLVNQYFLNSPYFEQKDQKHKDKCLKRKDYLHRTIMKILGGKYGQLPTNI